MTTVTTIDEAFPQTGESAVLRLRLGACRLQVRPGGNGSWVTGTYRDPSDRRPLVIEREGSNLTLRQKASVSGTVGMISGVAVCDLVLGNAHPFALHLDTGGSDAALDLSAVPLSELDVNAGAGKIQIQVLKPNPAELERASFALGAGALDSEGLGNLSPRALQVKAGASRVGVDLTGELRHHLEASISTGVAGVTVTVPATRRIRISTDTRLGGLDLGDGFMTRDGAITTPGEGDPEVEVEVQVALGSLRLRTA